VPETSGIIGCDYNSRNSARFLQISMAESGSPFRVEPPRDNSWKVGNSEVEAHREISIDGLPVTRDQSLGRQGCAHSGFDVPEISVVDGVDFNRAE
jgi:hypothetical protein